MGDVRRFFTIPTFCDPQQDQLARILDFHLPGMILGYTVISFVLMWILRWPILLGAAMAAVPLAVNLALLAAAKRGRLLLAAFFLVVELWLLLTLFAFLPGGVGARAGWGFFIIVFNAGMMLGQWASIAAMAICSLTTLAIAFLSRPQSPHPWAFWLINSLFLLVMIYLQHLAVRSIRASLAKVRSELRERLQVQEALAASEKKHREMVNSLPFCVFEADLDGRIQFVNQTGLGWFGYSPDELASGFNVYQILDVADARRARDNIGRLLAGGELGYREYRVKRKDGSVFTALIRTQIISENGIPVSLQGSLIDISERKQAEKEREQIISLLRATLESTADGILVVDTAGRIAHFNRRFKEMWRIPDEVLASGADSSAVSFVLDQLTDPVGFSDNVQRLYATPLEESFDLLEFKDGRFFERYSRPQLLAGQPVGRVWSFRDVSERRRSESALLASHQFVTSLLRAIPVAVFFKDEEGRYTGCNDEFTEIMGVTSEEIKGKTVHQVWPSALADIYHQKDLELMRERKHQVYEFHVKDKSGKLRPVIYARDVILNANGEVQGLVGAFLDISERKQAERALQESELRYRSLFEAASDAILIMKGNHFHDCNSKALEMYGCSREQIIGSSPDLFSPPFQPDGGSSREKALRLIAAAYAGQPQFFVWIHCRADQALFTAEVSLNRIEISGELYLLSIVRDITDRRRLEEQLLQAQKMEAIGILAGGVAHDFNNILSTIVGYGSLLQLKLKAQEGLHDYIERILSSCERAVSLTSSLLSFSRKQEVDLQPVEINSVITVFHKMLSRLISENIEFGLHLHDHSLVVEVDVRQFEQVLMNLVNNSRDAMPNGGRLTIATETLQLLEPNGEILAGSYVLISVNDTGSGIEEKALPHIFEPFFTTKTVSSGTGLGMAIVYGIIKKHNGFITVDSVVGKGTTFRIFLPLKSIELKEQIRKKDETLLHGSETVLLIEDDATVRQVIHSILQEFGYRVIEAADGDEAVSIFSRRSTGVHVILSDLILPKKNGWEAVAEIRRIDPDVKVLYMSGYEADFLARQGNPDPAAPLLLKPIQPLALLTQLRQAIDSSRSGSTAD